MLHSTAKVSAVMAASFLALTLTGCATHSAPTTVGTAPPATSTDESTRLTTADQLSFLDLSAVANEIFSRDMTALAAQSQIVALGTVKRWLAGDRVTTATGMDVGAVILAEFTVSKVVTSNGDSRLAPGDTLYLPFPGGMDIGTLAESAPHDLDALVYLDRELSSEDLAVGDEYVVEKGDPEAAGAPRWVLTGSQGFVVVDQSAPGQVVWPMLGNTAAGTLQDALPGGTLDGLNDQQRAVADTYENEETPEP